MAGGVALKAPLSDSNAGEPLLGCVEVTTGIPEMIGVALKVASVDGGGTAMPPIGGAMGLSTCCLRSPRKPDCSA